MVIMIPAKILTLGGEWNKRMDRVRSRARSSMGSRARRILMEGIDSRGIFQNRRSQGDIHTPGEADCQILSALAVSFRGSLISSLKRCVSLL